MVDVEAQKVYRMELDWETGFLCTLCLYTNVTNIAEVRKKVMTGALHCCIVKASLVVDTLQVIVAANKAALNAKHNQLITKSVYTEILFCLSTSKNITRSLCEFGISDDDKHILVILLHKPGEDLPMLTEIQNSVEGERVPVSKIQEFTDINLVKKTYKISDNELHVSSLVKSIVSRISCKEFM